MLDDKTIDFFFNFTKSDFEIAKNLVQKIYSFHPSSQVLAVSDGNVSNARELSYLHPGLVLVEGESLKNKDIGVFTTRNISCILAFTTAEFIIRLDPDTEFLRPIQYLLNCDWGGFVNQGKFSWGYSIWARGGGFFIKRSALERMADSKIILHPRYRELQTPDIRDSRLYEDCRFGHAANSLDIFPQSWGEVLSGGLRPKDRRHRRVALWHNH